MINSIGKVSGEVIAVTTEKDVTPLNEINVSSGNTTELKAPVETTSRADVSVVINGKEQTNATDNKNKKNLTEKDVKQMSEALNEFMSKLNCNMEFSYHEKLGRFSVKMVDQKTKEVIKEFPPEKILEAMERTRELIGVILDKKA